MQLETGIGEFYMLSPLRKRQRVAPTAAAQGGIARAGLMRFGERLVSEDDEQDLRNYLVVCNSEEQYSIWPSHKPIPRGWRSVGKEGRKAECLKYIESVWIDMRPRSLRENNQSRLPESESPEST